MARRFLRFHWLKIRPDAAGRVYFLLSMYAILVSSILQIAYDRIPQSISGISPEWFDLCYQLAQIVCAVSVLAGMCWRDPYVGLSLERFGCVLGFTIGVIYGVSVGFQNSGPPLSSGVWLVLAISVYFALRAYRITRVFGEACRESHRDR